MPEGHEHLNEDERHLAKLGYVQELTVSMAPSAMSCWSSVKDNMSESQPLRSASTGFTA